VVAEEAVATAGGSVPVVDGLFEDTADGPRLLGSRCAACRAAYFPRTAACRNPACPDGRLEDALFGANGTLWSYTVQHYAPPPPVKFDEPFVPYALGLVDLPEGLRVLARIQTDNIDALTAGAALTLVIAPLSHDAEGRAVVSFQFRPAQDGGAPA
jgi:uncharacterized OB-fold protein